MTNNRIDRWTETKILRSFFVNGLGSKKRYPPQHSRKMCSSIAAARFFQIHFFKRKAPLEYKICLIKCALWSSQISQKWVYAFTIETSGRVCTSESYSQSAADNLSEAIHRPLSLSLSLGLLIQMHFQMQSLENCELAKVRCVMQRCEMKTALWSPKFRFDLPNRFRLDYPLFSINQRNRFKNSG